MKLNIDCNTFEHLKPMLLSDNLFKSNVQSKSNNKTILDLPSHLIRKIIIQLNYPTHKLVHLRMVSKQWKSIINKTIFADQETLNLFTSIDDIKSSSKDNCLVRSKAMKNVKFGSFLVRLFPRLQSLVVCLNRNVGFYRLSELVRTVHYIKTLSIIGELDPYYQNDNFCSNLFETIENHLSHLTDLEMSARNLIHYNRPRWGKPLIKMLKTFWNLQSLTIDNYQGEMIHVFTQLGPKCIQLRLGDGLTSLNESFPKIRSYFPNCFHSVRMLSLPTSANIETILFCLNYFKELNVLELSFDKNFTFNYFGSLLFSLSSLPKLYDLRLNNLPLMIDSLESNVNLYSVYQIRNLQLQLFCDMNIFQSITYIQFISILFPLIENLEIISNRRQPFNENLVLEQFTNLKQYEWIINDNAY